MGLAYQSKMLANYFSLISRLVIKSPASWTKVDMVLVLALATGSLKSWGAPWQWNPYSVSVRLFACDLIRKSQRICTFSRATMI